MEKTSNHKTNAYNRYRKINIQNVGGATYSKPIMCIETKEVFDSITDCAIKMKLHKASISSHLIGKEKYKTVGEYTFKTI